MRDPYEVLGVQPGATYSHIHAQFRRLAKELHPDAGGDAARFQEVADAWAILGDAEKRAAYDAGETIDTRAGNDHAPAIAVITNEVQALLTAFGDKDGAVVITTDVVALIVSSIDDKIRAIEVMVEKMKRDIVRFNDVAQRFDAGDQTNYIRRIIENRIQGIEQGLPRAEAETVNLRKARELVLHHTFRVDEVCPPGGMVQVHVTTSNASGLFGAVPSFFR